MTDAEEYNIYRSIDRGTYGFLTSAKTTSYVDDGSIDPDTEDTVPEYQSPFKAGDFPRVSGFFQQRQFYGSTTNQPLKFWASVTGDFENFSRSSPIKDDDGFEATIAGQRVNEIRAFSSLEDLVILTSGSAWLVSGDSNGVIKPNAVNLRRLSYDGAAAVEPVTVADSIIFSQERGSLVREFGFNLSDGGASGFVGRDLTVWSPHLVDGYTISEWAYGATPHPIVWAVRSDGDLLGLTYVKEQDVWAWHRHDTGGSLALFQSVAVIPEGGVDVAYFIVRRVISGVANYYIERLVPRTVGQADYDQREDTVFVDSALSYIGTSLDSTGATSAATMTLSGGSTWAAGESLTLTASLSIIAGTEDGWRLKDALGNEVEVTYVSGSGTSCTVTADQAVPALLQGAAADSWVLMVDSLSGLDHLEAKTVTYLMDAETTGTATVSSGAITLPSKAGVVWVGMPIDYDLVSLDADIVSQTDSVFGLNKRISGATLLFEDTLGASVGRTIATAQQLKETAAEAAAYSDPSPPDLLTKKVDVNWGGQYDRDGRFAVTQTQPLPVTVLSWIPRVEFGGK